MTINELDKIPSDPKFVIFTQGSTTSKDEWYGPPDPQPSGYTTNYHLSLEAYDSESKVIEWIQKNQTRKYGQPEKFRVFKMTPVNVTTNVSISLE